MNTTAEVLLEVSDLSVSFAGEAGMRSAVDALSLKLCKGSTLAIVGESGSGKSVTALAVIGLLPAKSAVIANGCIRLHNHILLDAASGADERTAARGRQISMIFQEPMTSLNPVMRCGLQVAEVLMLHKGMDLAQARSRVVALFREVHLPDPETAWHKYPHEMSGGQRQRVMIAMAMASEPELLIADEPTTALDVTVQGAILATLKELQQSRGMAMLFITHDLGVVADMADYVLVMRGGLVVEYGTVQDVLQRPAHAYTRALMACRPALGVKRDVLPTVSDPSPSPLPAPQLAAVRELLRVEGLGKTFRTRAGTVHKAVDNVSFSIQAGETLGLVGESGCGKSTLSRMVMGLIAPETGQVLFDGRVCVAPGLRVDPAYRKKVQLIFQDPYSSLNPRLTIGEAICEPMRIHSVGTHDKQRRELAAGWLEKTGLTAEAMKRYPHEFSGGQRQRIVIARALALESQVLICDESVSALDVSVQAQVLNLLKTLQRELRLSYLFISHDLAVVYHMSEQIMVMRNGSIEERGPAVQVLHQPRSAYTQKLLESIPGLA